MVAKTPERTPAEASQIGCESRLQSFGERRILRLTDDASAKLPSRGQVAVTGLMNGHRFSTVLEPDGMRGHWLEIEDEMYRAHALDEGGAVELEITPTKDWPEPVVPGDFVAALADAPDIAELWRSITPMARWEWVRWINATANPATRHRRIEVGISKLRSGKRRPCCFDLSACTDPELSKNGRLVDSL